jgi:hypothetical protein
VATTGEMKNVYNSSENLAGQDHFGDAFIDSKMALKLIFKKYIRWN